MADTSGDKIVTVTGYVRQSVRDRFAALTRLEGLSIAAVIRSFVEGHAGTGTSQPRQVGAAHKLSLRLSEAARVKLRQEATARGSTPNAYAAALIEAQMLGTPQWSADQLVELKAARRIVAEVRDRLNGAESTKGVEASLALIDAAIRKNVAYWTAKAPAGVLALTASASVPGRAHTSHGAVSPKP